MHEVFEKIRLKNSFAPSKIVITSKPLNSVCFGNYRVRARVASFDRNDTMEGRRPRKEQQEKKVNETEGNSSGQVKEGVEGVEGVRVGDVLVWLGGQKKHEGNAGAPSKRVGEPCVNVTQHAEKESLPDARVYVRKYKPAMEDVKWAQN
ncbi:hypothetical protein A2U01_0043461, partial [Trifolium medium]|nr:hypothetical protein [Trifolium medium]